MSSYQSSCTIQMVTVRYSKGPIVVHVWFNGHRTQRIFQYRVIPSPGQFVPWSFLSLIISELGHLAPRSFRPWTFGSWVILFPGNFIPGLFRFQVITISGHFDTGSFRSRVISFGSSRVILMMISGHFDLWSC